MLHIKPRDEWRARQRAMPNYTIMTFVPDGLMLGVGTVLVSADDRRGLQSLHGREMRILALLSAAHGKAVAPATLGNIERAMKAWREGDDGLAYIHLAHAGLPPLDDFQEGACRLFLADGAMKAGADPRAVLAALHLDAHYISTVEKLYNPKQPRVPAGSGPTSGERTDGDAARAGTAEEDTRGSSLPRRMPPSAASFMGTLDAAGALELGLFAARIATPVGAAAEAFGLLFIPSPNNIHVEGNVPQIPGLRYSWNRDETRLLLKYDQSGGAQRTVALRISDDDVVDEDEKVVGKIVGGNRVAIDTIAVLPDLVRQDEPRLCPAPAADIAGSDQGKPYEDNRSRQYEDFVKRLINPPPNAPTPSGFVYYLPNPEGGDPVSYDDCEKTTGTMFEIKGEAHAKLTRDLPDAMAPGYLKQAARQFAASGGRSLVWIFAEEDAALFARKQFDENGLEGITVGYIPWTRSGLR